MRSGKIIIKRITWILITGVTITIGMEAKMPAVRTPLFAAVNTRLPTPALCRTKTYNDNPSSFTEAFNARCAQDLTIPMDDIFLDKRMGALSPRKTHIEAAMDSFPRKSNGY